MKYLILLILSLFISVTHAEDLLVPISKFDNDSQQLTNSRVLEFWAYHNYEGSDNYVNTPILRYYNLLEFDSWRGHVRLDTSVVSNFNSLTAPNGSGQYSAGNTMLIVWGQDHTFLKPLHSLFGGRVIFPFVNNGQWAVGPQLGWTFTPEVDSLLHVTDFSPLLRYMCGFDTKNNSFSVNPNQPPLLRKL